MLFVLVLLVSVSLVCCGFDPTGFSFKTQINVTNTNGTDLEDQEVLIVINTQEMVERDMLRDSCSDMAFVLERTQEKIEYYLENSCDRVESRFYVRMDLSMTPAENTIILYHRKIDLISPDALQFDGEFIIMTNESCTGGWAYDSSFQGKLPFINSPTVGNAFSGFFSHNHLLIAQTGTDDGSSFDNSQNKLNANCAKTDHKHMFYGFSEYVLTMEEILPEYVHTVYCKSSRMDIPQFGIQLYKDAAGFGTSPQPSAYDVNLNRFNLGASTFGFLGGNVDHTHSYVIDSLESNSNGLVKEVAAEDATPNFALNTHVHEISGSVNGFTNAPSHVEMIFGMDVVDDASIFPLQNKFYLANAIPPLGFSVSTVHDGYFFLSTGAYGTMNGAAGEGVIEHIHTFDIDPNPSESEWQSFHNNNEDWERSGIDHGHSVIVEDTISSSYTLPFYTVMLLERNPIYNSIFINGSFQIAVVENYTVPSCDLTCLNDGVCLYNATTEDWWCNCTSDWIGSICDVASGNGGDDDTCVPSCSNNGTCRLNSSSLAYYCDCDSAWTGVSCSVPLNADGLPDLGWVAIVAGVVGGLCLVIIVVAVCLSVVTFGVLAKRKKESDKLLSTLVGNVEKEVELAEEKTKLEEDKVKLEGEKKKLEEEKEQDAEEKKKLKAALEALKSEKTKLARETFSAVSLEKAIKIIKEKDVKMDKKLMTNPLYLTYKGYYEKKPVLVRVFPKSLFKSPLVNVLDLLEMEVRRYGGMKHPNILPYQAMCRGPKIFVVSAFPFNSTLKSFYGRAVGKKMKFLEKIRLLYEVANGLQYLHQQGLKHGCVRAQSIFITKGTRPQLDFGFNLTFNVAHKYSQYAAPEIFKPSLLYGDDDDDDDDDSEDSEEETHLEESNVVKVDIYAFGVLMLEVISLNFNLYKVEKGKKEPLGEKTAEDENHRPPLGRAQKYYPNWFVNLLKLCWKHNPAHRPSISRIKTIIETVVFDKDEE